MAEKIEESSVEPETPPSKNKKKSEAEASRESSSDLRALLLILVLAVIMFFVLLYKQKHPQEYAQSVIQMKESAGAAYSRAEEALPVAYRDIGGFFEYASDLGRVPELPPELPKVRISQDSTVTEFVSEVASGALSSTGSFSPTEIEARSGVTEDATEDFDPLAVEFSGYRIEFDRPPAERVTLSVGGAEIVVGPSAPTKERNNVSE